MTNRYHLAIAATLAMLLASPALAESSTTTAGHSATTHRSSIRHMSRANRLDVTRRSFNQIDANDAAGSWSGYNSVPNDTPGPVGQPGAM